ncbi:MAG: hypothetical protein NXI23_04615 [Bacteroidetes bacterium]|nr:hypothetical protein [Bacteroidota bacterium]MDF1863788.1 hypothetical protein [Saprospiraceae bacterium]
MRTSQLINLCLLSFSALFFQNCQITPENTETAKAEVNAQALVEEIAKLAVAPPMENLDVKYNNFQVSPTESKILELKNGTSIEIPENAFVDANGNPVTESVQIQYREFHNAAELIASGIPMEVIKENGQKELMQTAGMFEMEGKTNKGERVFIAEDKEVKVNMASHIEGEYPFWYFDHERGNWEEMGTNTPTPNPKREAAELALTQMEKSEFATMKAPIKPIKFDRKKPALNFDINYDNFPELKQMRGIVWQYSGTKSKLDPVNNKWIFKEQWDFVKLEASDKVNQYNMVLTNADKNFVIPVCPSQKGKDFDKAMKEFQTSAAEYREYVENKTAKKEFLEAQAKFVRSFAVNRFGIHNYDILIKRPNAVRLMANFDFGKFPGHVKKMIPVYLVTGQDRSIVAFPYESWDRFVFSPEMENKLIAVLPGNKLATFSQREFFDQKEAMVRRNNGSYDFKMTIHDQEVKTINDIQHILNGMS